MKLLIIFKKRKSKVIINFKRKDNIKNYLSLYYKYRFDLNINSLFSQKNILKTLYLQIYS